MNTILSNISYNKKYTDEISKSKYTQKTDNEKVEKYEKLEDLIIYTFDVDSVLEKNNRMYINTKKLELASNICDNYENYNYSKIFSKKIIQNGLQKINTLTTILYLSDIYKISITIYYCEKYYKLFEKKRTDLFVEYRNHSWIVVTEKKIDTLGKLSELQDIIDLNIGTINIYNRYLKSIGNYKIAELIDIAEKNSIPIDIDGKRKKKQELYDDINRFFF